MKINWGKERWTHYRKVTLWHRYFAILPRRVGFEDYRLLEYIERRKVYDVSRGFLWEYREVIK